MAQYYACGEVAKPSSMSFADFLDYWIDNDCKAILNETTIDHYQKKIKNLIAPTLGGYRLSTMHHTSRIIHHQLKSKSLIITA